jgi:hypothetical protein
MSLFTLDKLIALRIPRQGSGKTGYNRPPPSMKNN